VLVVLGEDISCRVRFLIFDFFFFGSRGECRWGSRGDGWDVSGFQLCGVFFFWLPETDGSALFLLKFLTVNLIATVVVVWNYPPLMVLCGPWPGIRKWRCHEKRLV
jgi:hypothetical protein